MSFNLFDPWTFTKEKFLGSQCHVSDVRCMQFPQRYISFKNFRFLVYHKERFQALKQFKIIQCFTPTKKERLNTKRESSMIYDLVTSQNFLANQFSWSPILLKYKFNPGLVLVVALLLFCYFYFSKGSLFFLPDCFCSILPMGAACLSVCVSSCECFSCRAKTNSSKLLKVKTQA